MRESRERTAGPSTPVGMTIHLQRNGFTLTQPLSSRPEWRDLRFISHSASRNYASGAPDTKISPTLTRHERLCPTIVGVEVILERSQVVRRIA
jgi:hypothetical protein